MRNWNTRVGHLHPYVIQKNRLLRLDAIPPTGFDIELWFRFSHSESAGVAEVVKEGKQMRWSYALRSPAQEFELGGRYVWRVWRIGGGVVERWEIVGQSKDFPSFGGWWKVCEYKLVGKGEDCEYLWYCGSRLGCVRRMYCHLSSCDRTAVKYSYQYSLGKCCRKVYLSSINV